jgi:hypothetical protein
MCALLSSRLSEMRPVVAALGLLLVVACQPDEAPMSSSPEQIVSKTAPAQLEDIRGDWRLARVGQRMASDQPPNSEIPPEIRLIVGDMTLRAYSQCVTFAWRYEREGSGVRIRADNPGPICGRGLSYWEKDFERSITAANKVRLIDGRLLLAGAAEELEFNSAPPPAIVDLKGDWKLRRLNGDEVESQGDPRHDIRMAITAGTMRAQSQCVAYWWRYRQSGQQLEMTPDSPGPVCDRTRTEWEQRFKRTMDSVNIGHRVDARTLILAGSGGQAEFSRLD